MQQPFAKYCGCGNDFILIDHRTHHLESVLSPKIISHLCHRHLGIGADGLILLENSSRVDFKMKIFNSDGYEAEMCGNGLRCLARFLCDLGIPPRTWTIETPMQCVEVTPAAPLISVTFPSPKTMLFNLDIDIDGKHFLVHYLDTGVPHCILFVDNIEDPALMSLAPRIRFHPRFHPKGANVNFVSIQGNGQIAVRTYERGVEAETLACGTGATASALAAAHTHQLQSPITIHPRSKEPMILSFSGSPEFPQQLTLSGPAIKIYEGTISLL